jgi:diadenosine tetraphosphatase ApaH/serine/threonine PP2A family protein phosphatase
VSATIVIGDVHGCVDELAALIDACAPGRDDHIVCVGDLVAKGPDSRGVLALVRERGVRSVLGNHDAVVLYAARALAAGERSAARASHTALARQLSAEDVEQLAALPLFLRLPELDTLVVHAGLAPGVPLEQQDSDVLLNVRTVDAAGKPSARPNAGMLWGSVWPGPELVLFGHHASAGLQRHPHAIGLDTGCVYGGRLTAYVLPEGRFVSVPARHEYRPIREHA